jgi:hypothetical protein
MRCVRFAILGALAFWPALAPISRLSPRQEPVSRNQNRAGKIVPRQFGPIQEKFDHGDGSADSSNWSGYVLLGSTFKWVAGSWIVPAADCTGLTGEKFAGFWVGMDGYNSPTVEQIGTFTNCARTKPEYYAWYELYPAGSIIIPSVTVKPGDRISAKVVYYDYNEKFALTIKDDTSGKSFVTVSTVSGALRSSAEWIAEAPCCTSSGGILPLTDFGTVTFGQENTGIDYTNYAVDTSTTGPIGSFPPVNTIEVNKTSTSSSAPTSTCSTLSNNGTSFSCTWKGLGR